jgi:hypothetical protein
MLVAEPYFDVGPYRNWTLASPAFGVTLPFKTAPDVLTESAGCVCAFGPATSYAPMSHALPLGRGTPR